MERHYIGLDVADDKDQHQEFVRLTVSPEALDDRKSSAYGILHSGLKLIPGKLYHFEIRLKQSKPLETFLTVTTGSSAKGIIYEEDNSSFDSLTEVWHHHWRLKIAKTPISAIGGLTSILFGIKAKCLDDQLEIIHAAKIENFVYIAEVEADDSIGAATGSSGQSASFDKLHNKVVTAAGDCPVEKYFAFIRQTDILLTDATNIKDAGDSKSPSYSYTCVLPSSLNLRLHSDFKSQFKNIVNYLKPQTDVILWSNPWQNKLHRDIQESMSPLSPCSVDLIEMLTLAELTELPFSLSRRAEEYYTKSVVSSPGARLKQTLVHFAKLPSEVTSSSELVVFCNPSLILSAGTTSTDEGTLYRNIKSGGGYDLLSEDDSKATRVTAVVVLDDCSYNEQEIKESIDSLCGQTYRNLEIFILRLGTGRGESPKSLVGDLRVRSGYTKLLDVLKDSTGSFILFQHVKMISLPTRISKQLGALSKTSEHKTTVVSCERGLKVASSAGATGHGSYETKIRSQINGYEIAMYNKNSLAMNVVTTSSAAAAIADKMTNYSSLMYSIFTRLMSDRMATATDVLQLPKDSLIRQSQYDFYFTIPEVLVKQ
jgi:hypothetical protein